MIRGVHLFLYFFVKKNKYKETFFSMMDKQINEGLPGFTFLRFIRLILKFRIFSTMTYSMENLCLPSDQYE